MIRDAIVALLASALAGTGVGGGGLLVIYLTAFRGWEQFSAQGENLLFFICGAAAAIPVHIRKRKINAGTVLMLGLAGAVGTYGGFLVAQSIGSSAMRAVFGAFLVFCGMKALTKRKPE